jgi:uncharacterized protein YfaS (alpha-2-macroglobulin family)
VFALTSALQAARTTVEVEAKDPAGNIIQRWHLDVSAGFAELSIPLSAKPVLGEWLLSASAEGFVAGFEAVFEVAEYVIASLAT